jgi:hypothetical protein
MRSPVLFLIFNRPALTKATFECIRQARPPRLYIAADGPREGRDGEGALCAEAREAVSQVDWPCEVYTLFRKRNIGCADAVSSAITWFFQQEAEGIILEDDLSIHPDFFPFCDEMLERYRDMEQVMHVHGNSFQYGQSRGEAAYYFSCFPHCWGWATWAKAWEKYDHAMTRLNWVASKKVPKLFQSEAAASYFRDVFAQVKNGQIDSWAFRWTFSVWEHSGLCVNPNVNMVRNIGFGEQSTHTTNPADILAHLPADGLENITHPQKIMRDAAADEWVADTQFVQWGNPVPVLLQEALRRLEAGTPDGVLGIVRVLRAALGDFGPLLHLEALALLQKGMQNAALAAATKWLEMEPLSDEAKKLIRMIKDGFKH